MSIRRSSACIGTYQGNVRGTLWKHKRNVKNAESNGRTSGILVLEIHQKSIKLLWKLRRYRNTFTHGATVDHRQFLDQVNVLIGRYRALLWDMRGHGESRPMGVDFTVPEAVDDLIAILDREGISKAIFVGQSTGTYVIQELVFRHPERVEALIVIDGTCITMSISAMDRLLLRSTPLILKMYPFETLKNQSAQASAIKKSVQDYMYGTMTTIGREDVINIMTGVANCMHAEPGYRVTQPILLVHGDHDKLGNIAKIAPEWAKRDPHVIYEVIPSAGHNSNQDNPEYFNKVMLDFLNKLS
jgi:3-oxoadipate enol-lactonase